MNKEKEEVTLYGVEKNFEGELSVVGTKATVSSKQYKLAERATWNACGLVVPVEKACFSPLDAVDRFLEREEGALENLKRQVDSQSKLVSRATQLREIIKEEHL